ncbi:Uncharacterised protein [Mycobacterium tuberculosis]|nr:Uncharacterised protein [Mycobacterium tuberculosis]
MVKALIIDFTICSSIFIIVFFISFNLFFRDSPIVF